MKIEEVSLGNYSEWSRLRRSLWGEAETEVRKDYERYRWKRHSGDALNLLAISASGEYLGFVCAELRRDHVEGAQVRPVWYIEGIYVTPEARRRGVGRLLVSTIERHAESEGHTVIGSDCKVDDVDSADFHKGIGFAESLRSIHLIKELECPSKSISSTFADSVVTDTVVVRDPQDGDRELLRQLFQAYWFGSVMAIRGRLVELFETEMKLACVGDGLVGAINYILCSENCEIASVVSDLPNRGIGTLLLEEVEAAARRFGCPIMTTATTNDNVSALRFWQKRGFELSGIDRDSMVVARQLKPSIPQTGQAGIPIRDEIILTKVLETETSRQI